MKNVRIRSVTASGAAVERERDSDADPQVAYNLKQSLYRPKWFQKFATPIFRDSRHMKAVIFSILLTGRLYSPENIPGSHFY